MTSYEKDLDPNKKIVIKGVKGMKSKPFTKKFKNMDAYEKWMDSDEADDCSVQSVMNESQSFRDFVDSAVNESFKVDAGVSRAKDLISHIEKMAKEGNKEAYDHLYLALLNLSDTIQFSKHIEAAKKVM